ncbi:hypothetical protein AVEN_24176-1 [Araneus ventricosus]|uniref:Uncharacterized protein n=1 Tax=Araneus ventricosus TaxID=182803 RepID=A0A4Y2HSB7_ARAVE|nr:hypothetical protein AVEN_24176-1 [Araneus ventricosus]
MKLLGKLFFQNVRVLFMKRGHHSYRVSFSYSNVRFEATRGLFPDGPRNFGPWSDDEFDTKAATPLQTAAPHQQKGVLGSHRRKYSSSEARVG